jgi:hypothetical protein
LNHNKREVTEITNDLSLVTEINNDLSVVISHTCVVNQIDTEKEKDEEKVIKLAIELENCLFEEYGEKGILNFFLESCNILILFSLFCFHLLSTDAIILIH